MGNVIRPSAGVDAIFADVRTALANAVAKGGMIKTAAEQRLGPTITTIDTVDADIEKANEVAAPLIAEMNAENDRADATLDGLYDEIWTDVDQPTNDLFLAELFVGGASYYTEGDMEDQPHRMELLAQLFEKGIHPKLTMEQNTAYAARVRKAAADLEEDVTAARLPSLRIKLFQRIRTTLGRSAQFALASLKRNYKKEGLTEAQIHEIIPDHPLPKKVTRKTSS